jgi:hypothetical protein
MTSRVKQLALKILLIKEEFSEKEIRDAVALLRNYGTESDLIEYLAHGHSEGRTPGQEKPTSKPLGEIQSKIVMELADKDEEKFKILSEFDSLLRKEKILPRVEDIRRLGNSISKDFPKIKSRKDGVVKLVKLLAEKPPEQVREVLQSCLAELSQSQDTSEYQQLAQFIISGPSDQNKK